MPLTASRDTIPVAVIVVVVGIAANGRPCKNSPLVTALVPLLASSGQLQTLVTNGNPHFILLAIVCCSGATCASVDSRLIPQWPACNKATTVNCMTMNPSWTMT